MSDLSITSDSKLERQGKTMSEFSETLEQLDNLIQGFIKESSAYQAKFDEFLKDEFKRQFPRKKKFDISLIKGFDELTKPYRDTADSMYKQYSTTKKDIENKLDVLADTAEIPTSDEWYEHYQTSGYYYGSQTRPEAYTEGDAKRVEQLCQTYGVEVKRTCEKQEISPYLIHKVWIKSNRVGSEIIKRRGCSLKDFVKSCWKNGVNPRVYNPFIPHGFEEENGLDYYGNEKV